jgi:hypothetical protein
MAQDSTEEGDRPPDSPRRFDVRSSLKARDVIRLLAEDGWISPVQASLEARPRHGRRQVEP